MGRDILIPVGAINRADHDRIALEISGDQTGDLKDFAVTSFVSAPPHAVGDSTWPPGALFAYGAAPVGAAAGLESISYTPIVETHEQIPEGDVDLRPGTEVWATDGKVGTVRDVIVDEQTKRVRAFTIQEGRLFHKDATVSIDQVGDIGTDRITLTIPKAEVAPTREP